MMLNPSEYTALKGKKVFVTGGAGFIGSHLVEQLVHVGCNVKVLVRYNSQNRWGWLDTLSKDVLDSIEVCPSDIRDAEFVRSFVKGADYGFHLAALIGIPYSYDAPRSYVDTNITGTLNVIQAVRESGIERLVSTSTSEVYGTAQYVPIDERHPLQGQSPYSASKIGADQMAESYYRSFGVPIVILRPFNTYGPRQSMRAVIPNLIMQCLAGGEVKMGNLDPTRDFNFVLDTVQGFLKASLAPQAEGEVINVGTGAEISIRDLITKVENMVGRKLNVVQEDQRLRPDKSEVFRLCACIDKAKALMDYKPQVSLDEGLKLTLEWAQANANLDKVAMYHV